MPSVGDERWTPIPEESSSSVTDAEWSELLAARLVGGKVRVMSLQSHDPLVSKHFRALKRRFRGADECADTYALLMGLDIHARNYPAQSPARTSRLSIDSLRCCFADPRD